MGKYDVDVKKYGEIKSIIDIPRFQRSPIWSETKKKELIQTIKKGLPIGSILLSKKGDRYELVDGLQRISTLKYFESNRFKYIDENEVTEEEMIKILNSDPKSPDYGYIVITLDEPTSKSYVALISEMKNVVVETMKNDWDKELNDISWDITGKLQGIALLAKFDVRKLQNCVFKLVDKINNILDVNEIKIPVIIFNNNGANNNAELIEIFTKMNSQGVTLSKYDIFSAAWQNCIIKLKTDTGKEIIESVINKYAISSEKAGLEISNFDPEDIRNTGKINIFEYAYAISKVLSNHSTFLFDASDESKVDSLGFTLLAGLFDIANKDMDKLGDTLKDYKIDYVYLANTLVEVVKELENTLEKWIASYDKTYYTCHSEMQLASYILVLHKLKYKINKDSIDKVYNKKAEQVFKNYLPRHYLFDVLRGYWAGSGDSKLDELISQPDNNRYSYDVDKTTFENQINTWMDEQNSKTRKTISIEVKMFLNYLHKGSFTALEVSENPFDFDHIIPKKKLEVQFESKGINIPFSTPCNLAKIPSFDNRSKREYTYYQLVDFKKNAIELSDEFLEKCQYPQKNEISFVNSIDTFTRENYMKFLNDRKKYLANKLITIIYGN